MLLRESCREDGKVRKRTLANLSCLSVEVIEGLKVPLCGGGSANKVQAIPEVLGRVNAPLGDTA